VNPEINPNPSEMRGYRGRLGRRMALILLPLTVIPLLAMGIGAYLRSRALLETQATSQMISAAEAQIGVLEDWASEREQRLQLGAQRAALREAGQTLLSAPITSSRYSEAEAAALSVLNDLRTRQGELLFSGLALLDVGDGKVLAATNPDWVGGTTTLLAFFPTEFNTLIQSPSIAISCSHPTAWPWCMASPCSMTPPARRKCFCLASTAAHDLESSWSRCRSSGNSVGFTVLNAAAPLSCWRPIR
jgi:hypothetical protein